MMHSCARQASTASTASRLAGLRAGSRARSIDLGDPDGLIVLQHYEHRSVGESAPVFSLKPADGFWYEHFTAEAERLWQDGVPWPLDPAVAVQRSSRPSFKDHFGLEVELSMDRARELLVTGVTRNTLITSSYH